MLFNRPAAKKKDGTMNSDKPPSPDDALFISKAIRAFAAPMLAGHPPEVQSAALADLTATWLAGYQGPGAENLRAETFALYIRLVLELVPINEVMLRELRGDRS